MEKDDKILVTAHEGMIGSAVLRCLSEQGFTSLLTTPAQVDPADQRLVLELFMTERPDYVFLTTTTLGGILANSTYPAEFIYQNIQIQSNIIHSAWKSGVKKLLFWASSCIYPKECSQPMKEEYLLTGKLEPTSEPYAMAKIAGIKMCQAYNRQYGTNYISVVPADLYGTGDDFDPETSHFLPALLRKIHQAKAGHQGEVVLWGTGRPRRECLYVDDLAQASIFLMNEYDGSEMINVGSGEDYSIRELVQLVCQVIGFGGEITFDQSKPDGAPRKLLDVSKIRKLGWLPKVGLEEGVRQTYQWFQEHVASKMSEGN